jgi:hypothetical protein
MATIRTRRPQHLQSNAHRWTSLSTKEQLRVKHLAKSMQIALYEDYF